MPFKVQINQTVFRDELIKGLSAPSFIDQAYNIANGMFVEEKMAFVDEIKSDEITVALKEESQDPLRQDNIVRSRLGGNLFSFLGFTYGEGDPTREPIELLEEISLKKTSSGAQYKRNQITYEFPVQYPSLQEIYNSAPPLDWDGRRSWLESVEAGIDNVTKYIFGNLAHVPQSKSTAGLQSEKEIDPSAYYRPPADGYILTKYKKFLDFFRSN